MANYNVDIEVAIKGSQKLQQFERTLKIASKEVGKVNAALLKTSKLEEKAYKVANVNNYARAVARAERAVRNAAVGTDAEKKAIEALARARKEHNNILERQNQLMKQAIFDQRTIIATADAGFGMQGPKEPKKPKPPRAATPVSASRGASISKRANAALTAGAFPLLFGGGAFTALGGAAGGALTGQLFGGATVAFQVLGSALDAFTAQTAQLGQALNPLTADLDALIICCP